MRKPRTKRDSRLINPYDHVEDAVEPTSTPAVAALVLAGTAGLVGLGAGTASAATDDDVFGFGSEPIEFGFTSGGGDLFSSAPGGNDLFMSADPSSFSFAEGVNLSSLALPELTLPAVPDPVVNEPPPVEVAVEPPPVEPPPVEVAPVEVAPEPQPVEPPPVEVAPEPLPVEPPPVEVAPVEPPVELSFAEVALPEFGPVDVAGVPDFSEVSFGVTSPEETAALDAALFGAQDGEPAPGVSAEAVFALGSGEQVPVEPSLVAEPPPAEVVEPPVEPVPVDVVQPPVVEVALPVESEPAPVPVVEVEPPPTPEIVEVPPPADMADPPAEVAVESAPVEVALESLPEVVEPPVELSFAEVALPEFGPVDVAGVPDFSEVSFGVTSPEETAALDAALFGAPDGEPAPGVSAEAVFALGSGEQVPVEPSLVAEPPPAEVVEPPVEPVPVDVVEPPPVEVALPVEPEPVVEVAPESLPEAVEPPVELSFAEVALPEFGPVDVAGVPDFSEVSFGVTSPEETAALDAALFGAPDGEAAPGVSAEAVFALGSGDTTTDLAVDQPVLEVPADADVPALALGLPADSVVLNDAGDTGVGGREGVLVASANPDLLLGALPAQPVAASDDEAAVPGTGEVLLSQADQPSAEPSLPPGWTFGLTDEATTAALDELFASGADGAGELFGSDLVGPWQEILAGGGELPELSFADPGAPEGVTFGFTDEATTEALDRLLAPAVGSGVDSDPVTFGLTDEATTAALDELFASGADGAGELFGSDLVGPWQEALAGGGELPELSFADPGAPEGVTFGLTDEATTQALDRLLAPAVGPGVDSDPITFGLTDEATTAALDALLGAPSTGDLVVIPGSDDLDSSPTVLGSGSGSGSVTGTPPTAVIPPVVGAPTSGSVGDRRTDGSATAAPTPGTAISPGAIPGLTFRGAQRPPVVTMPPADASPTVVPRSTPATDAPAPVLTPYGPPLPADGAGDGRGQVAPVTSSPESGATEDGSAESGSFLGNLFRLNPDFDPLDPQAWTPTAETGVYTAGGTIASSLLNGRLMQQQFPGMTFSQGLMRQAPGQPLNILRDVSMLGIGNQRIFENDIVDLVAKGSLGSAAGIGTQALARNVLNPAANNLLLNNQSNRIHNYLNTGNERMLRGITGNAPDIRFDAPLDMPQPGQRFNFHPTLVGINFAVPAANLAVNSALEATGQQDNYWARLGGSALAMCVGVGGPISAAASIAARRPTVVWPACYYPAGQATAARLLTDPPPGVDVGPLGQALIDTCSDENIVLDVGKQVVCSLGRNNNDQPPASFPGILAVGDDPPGAPVAAMAIEGTNQQPATPGTPSPAFRTAQPVPGSEIAPGVLAPAPAPVPLSNETATPSVGSVTTPTEVVPSASAVQTVQQAATELQRQRQDQSQPVFTQPTPTQFALTQPGATQPGATQPVATQPVQYAPLPGGGQGVVVDRQDFTGTGNPRDTAGSAVTVEDPATGRRYVSIQPTRVRNTDGTETIFVPQVGGERVGWNPTGQTALVVELPAGATGRVTPQTRVEEVRVRTQAAPTLQFNGGGDPTRSVSGMAYRDRDWNNPVNEEWTIFPATYTDWDTGQVRYTAQVPAGYEGRVDLTQPGVIRLSVPAGSRPVAVSQTRQVYTPAPTYTAPTYTAPTNTAPTYTTPTYTAPTTAATSPRPAPTPAPVSRPAPQPQPQPNPVQQGLDWANRNIAQPVGQAFNNYQNWSREQLRTTIVSSQARDGVLGFGVTEHDVSFMDGGRGIYDPEGNLLRTQSGNPPQKVPGWQLFNRALGGSTPLIPAPAGMPAAPMLPAF